MPLGEVGELTLRQLFALNILLQIADGTLTHGGLGLGFVEGNPVLSGSMSVLGVGTALLLWKAHACGLLFLVRRSPSAWVSGALLATAVTMTLFALVPWIGKYASFAAFLLTGV